MGYHTEFNGSFTITPALPPVLIEYINTLSSTRRMARTLPKHFGIQGEFFVDGTGDFGQDEDGMISDYNRPSNAQPSLWCQWIIGTENGTELGWDGGEKFYNYVEWLAYIYKQILRPLGYTLSGEVEWRGEDWSDTGRIEVIDSVITAPGYRPIDCTPDATPRFLAYVKATNLLAK